LRYLNVTAAGPQDRGREPKGEKEQEKAWGTRKGAKHDGRKGKKGEGQKEREGKVGGEKNKVVMVTRGKT